MKCEPYLSIELKMFCAFISINRIDSYTVRRATIGEQVPYSRIHIYIPVYGD